MAGVEMHNLWLFLWVRQRRTSLLRRHVSATQAARTVPRIRGGLGPQPRTARNDLRRLWLGIRCCQSGRPSEALQSVQEGRKRYSPARAIPRPARLKIRRPSWVPTMALGGASFVVSSCSTFTVTATPKHAQNRGCYDVAVLASRA